MIKNYFVSNRKHRFRKLKLFPNKQGLGSLSFPIPGYETDTLSAIQSAVLAPNALGTSIFPEAVM